MKTRILHLADRVILPESETDDCRGLLVCNGHIEDLLFRGPLPVGVEVREYPGSVIAPTFCDYHLHAPGSAEESIREAEARLLSCGITRIYDAGGRERAGRDGMAWISGRLQVISAVHGLHKRGGYGSYIGIGIAGIEDVRPGIDALVARGAGFIKVIQSGIYDPATDRITPGGFEPDELSEIIHYARDLGMAVHCHANGETAVDQAIACGASVIIHGLGLTDDAVERMAEEHVGLIPTLHAFETLRARCGDRQSLTNLERVMDRHLAVVKRADRMGVRVLPGSDSGPTNLPFGSSFLQELSMLSGAGMPVASVVRNASAAGLQKGGNADFVVLRGVTPAAVVIGGKLLV